MTEVLQKLSDDTLYNVQKSLDSLYTELNLELGTERFKNEIYTNVLWLSNLIDDEYIKRKDKERAEASVHNLNYDYKDNINEN